MDDPSQVGPIAEGLEGRAGNVRFNLIFNLLLHEAPRQDALAQDASPSGPDPCALCVPAGSGSGARPRSCLRVLHCAAEIPKRARTLKGVRDEEAAGSNPVTPTSARSSTSMTTSRAEHIGDRTAPAREYLADSDAVGRPTLPSLRPPRLVRVASTWHPRRLPRPA